MEPINDNVYGDTTCSLLPKNIQQYANCPICFNPRNNNSTRLKCGHYFCTDCIEKWLETVKTCPVCRCIVERHNDVECQSDWYCSIIKIMVMLIATIVFLALMAWFVYFYKCLMEKMGYNVFSHYGVLCASIVLGILFAVPFMYLGGKLVGMLNRRCFNDTPY